MRAARQDRARFGFDGDDLESGQARLQRLADAGDRATGADAGNEDIQLAAGVAPDLLGRGAYMDGWIGRVLELLRHEAVEYLLEQLLCAGDRAVDAPLARRALR